jgi:myo-inositol-1(or 4)-monophosphatase
MMLEVLRDIGRRLLREIKPGPPSVSEEALPRGAAGDATHPLDTKAEEIIIRGLEASGLPLSVISEEAGFVELNGGGGRRVLVDPVDGSRNAAAGIPFYCTSIAVSDGKALRGVELAYILNLANGDEFWAEKGGGAFKNGERIATQRDDILRLVAFDAHVPGREIPRLMPLLSQTRKARCLGSTALALAYLAAGGASVFVVPSLSRSFDFAAGWLLVREAGGIFTDLEGRDLGGVEAGLEHITTILASANAALHNKALDLLGRKS